MTLLQKLATYTPVELDAMHRVLRSGKVAGTWGNLFPTHPGEELTEGGQQADLGAPTEDPRADKSGWVNPWAQKGTESLTAGVEIHEDPRHSAPRPDARRHLDTEEQDILKDEGKVGHFRSALLRR